jgi:hypothetical protein
MEKERLLAFGDERQLLEWSPHSIACTGTDGPMREASMNCRCSGAVTRVRLRLPGRRCRHTVSWFEWNGSLSDAGDS